LYNIPQEFQLFPEENEESRTFNDLIQSSSHKSNYEIIEEMFGEKLNQYSSLGYFSQVYESSLQATYYALFILDAIGKLDQINQPEIIEYIMSHYLAESSRFMDSYSHRHQNTYYPIGYRPLTSLLQVNCYAILSLDLLGRLDLIDKQTFTNFIWSCYNPIGSGFLGQPYDPRISDPYRISTMDNVFFAVMTLNVLMDDWTNYPNEISDLVQYITSLQYTGPNSNKIGSFYNHFGKSFNSLAPIWEPSLLPSYYCIKTLQLLGKLNSINVTTFNQYLYYLYDPSLHFFLQDLNDRYIFSGTALGLELSEITGLSSIMRDEVLEYIYNNRNHLGLWDQSPTENTCELIDTFQIIRSLKEVDNLISLTSQDKTNLANSLELFHQLRGYSPLSEDFTSLNLISSVVSSFGLFNRIPDLDTESLNSQIQNCVRNYEYLYFAPLIKANGLRTCATEYFNIRNDQIFIYETHRNTFMALNSLRQINKLEEFGLRYNLNKTVKNILTSQFLELGYENYGTFQPNHWINVMPAEYRDMYINFEYSYYAIKTLDLLVDFLGIGKLLDLDFNKGALYGYIARNLQIANGTIHFNPHGVSDTETLLQHNYYMIYILKMLDLFDLDRGIINQFLFENIDYENIKNIYYCYKIDEILDLDFAFNVSLTHRLVDQLYDDKNHEFYENVGHQAVNQEIFLWICEMAMNDKIYLKCDYRDTINLGSINTITVNFSNLILREYGQLTVVQLESEQLGTVKLEKQYDNSYQVSFMVPEEPKYFPYVEGTIMIFEHSKLIGQIPISFQTSLVQEFVYEVKENRGITEFQVNISRKLSANFQALLNSTVILDLFINDTKITTQNFTHEDFGSYSSFTLMYEHKLEIEGILKYKVTLVDEFFPDGFALFDHYIDSSSHEQDPPIFWKVNRWFLVVPGVLIGAIIPGVIVKVGRKIKKKLNGEEKKEEKVKNDRISEESKQEDKIKQLDERSFKDWF
jgi:prenyltransferase beta subunit